MRIPADRVNGCLRSAHVPQRLDPPAEGLWAFGEKPAGQALRRRSMCRPGAPRSRNETGAPRRERLVWSVSALQEDEVMMGAEPVAQALRLRNPKPDEPRPRRLDKLHLVAVLDNALAQPVQGLRGALSTSRAGRGGADAAVGRR